jgi:DNA repair protein RadC
MKYLKKLQIKLIRSERKNPVQGQVREPKQLYDIFRDIKDEAQELLVGVFLDENLMVKAYDILSVGGQSTTSVLPPEIFGRGFVLLAQSFILIHNHPRGNPTPSPDDYEVMRVLLQQSHIMNISFLDFIIVGDSGYWSMFEEFDGGNYELGGIA